MTGRCSLCFAYLMHGGDEAATRRGHHDDCCDLLFASSPLHDPAATTDMRTLDPAIARLLLGSCTVDNDLQPLTAEQSQRAALARLRFAVQFPEVASASSQSQSQPQK